MTTAESSKAAMSLNDVLRICCSRGWAGFKAEWIADQVTAGAAGTGRPNRQEALEQQNQAVAGGSYSPMLAMQQLNAELAAGTLKLSDERETA